MCVLPLLSLMLEFPLMKSDAWSAFANCNGNGCWKTVNRPHLQFTHCLPHTSLSEQWALWLGTGTMAA